VLVDILRDSKYSTMQLGESCCTTSSEIGFTKVFPTVGLYYPANTHTRLSRQRGPHRMQGPL